MEITRNRFCGVFLKNHKYLREMSLWCPRDVMEKTSFFRYVRDVLKTSHKIHLFKMFLRRLKDVTKKTSFLRCIWNVLKASRKVISFEMFLKGLWDVSLNGYLIESSQRLLTPAGQLVCNFINDSFLPLENLLNHPTFTENISNFVYFHESTRL